MLEHPRDRFPAMIQVIYCFQLKLIAVAVIVRLFPVVTVRSNVAND